MSLSHRKPPLPTLLRNVQGSASEMTHLRLATEFFTSLFLCSQLTTHVLFSKTLTPVSWALTTSMVTTSVVKFLGQSGGTLPHRAAYQEQCLTSGK